MSHSRVTCAWPHKFSEKGDNMPIFEYICKSCGEAFEKLVFGNQEITCPKCNSEDVKKKFSVFCASGTERPLAGTAVRTSSCSSCTKTSCSSCH